MKIESVPIRRHLVIDEEARVAHKHGASQVVRVRVWRARGSAPIALASQVEGEGPPSWASSKIANHVNAGVLRYPPEGLIYYEADRDAFGEPRLWLVSFEVFGHADRARLHHPAREQRRWAELEAAVGERVAV